jgi:hypothetical protein
LAITPKEDFQGGLSRFLPDCVDGIFFGPLLERGRKKNDATITEWCVNAKKIPTLTVYVLHSSPDNAGIEGRALQLLFANIPCRLFQLTWKDFLPEQPQVANMSLPSVASLKAIIYDTEELGDIRPAPPILLLNAGATTFTYMATDRRGNVLGEGICPSLNYQFTSVQEEMGLPLAIGSDKNEKWETLLEEYLQKQDNNKSEKVAAIPLFAASHSTAVVSGILHSVVGTLQSIIRGWKRQWTSTATPPSTNETFMIWIDGGYAKWVLRLLQPKEPLQEHHGKLVEDYDGMMSQLLPDDAGDTDKKWSITVKRHLAHDGIGCVLRSHNKDDHKHALGRKLVGQRVAQTVFGKALPLFGTIVSMVRRVGGPPYPFDVHYQVRFDDRESKELTLQEITGKSAAAGCGRMILPLLSKND